MITVARAMPKILAWILSACTVGAQVAACANDDARGAGGGSAVDGSTTAAGSDASSATGDTGDVESACLEDDGFCDWPDETCACADCGASRRCERATCVDDGACLAGEPCVCPDCGFLPLCTSSCGDSTECEAYMGCGCAQCAADPSCEGQSSTCTELDPSGCACVDDGTCDLSREPCQCPDCHAACNSACGVPDGACIFSESCGCVDCAAQPRCADFGSTCAGGAVDGACGGDEPCDCPDCSAFGRCTEPRCDGAGTCNSALEWCICPGCSIRPVCNDIGSCFADGVCSSFEGCLCDDCVNAPECAAWVDDCDGGVSDGTCGAGEPCSCHDCARDVKCVTCDDDGDCGALESCLCLECQTGAGKPTHCYPAQFVETMCVDDGVCDAWSEGCQCADCVSLAPCEGQVASCEGAAVDGTCGTTEACSCPDCWGKGRCISLDSCSPADGVCESTDVPLCADCTDISLFCDSNGACSLQGLEGCDCADCADAPTCG